MHERKRHQKWSFTVPCFAVDRHSLVLLSKVKVRLPALIIDTQPLIAFPSFFVALTSKVEKALAASLLIWSGGLNAEKVVNENEPLNNLALIKLIHVFEVKVVYNLDASL